MFDINFMGRVSSGANDRTKRIWVYDATDVGSNDSVATVSAAGYFNDFQVNLLKGLGPLREGDVIFVAGNDAHTMLVVTQVEITVVTSVFASSGTVGTANISNNAVTAAKLATSAVTNAKVADGAISAAKLGDDVKPSHVVKYAARVTTAGGAASEAIAVAGALATDIQQVTVVNNGTNNVTLLEAAVSADTLTLTFSGNPGTDTVVAYSLLRAVVA